MALSIRALLNAAAPRLTRLTPSVHAYSTSSSSSPSSDPSAGDAAVTVKDESASTPAVREPYSFPYHMPHKGARVEVPTIIEGKETRPTYDPDMPKEGVFTADNAWLSTIPLDVRSRTARKLDRLLPGEELPILTDTQLKLWWEARMKGMLPTNPTTPEAVKDSQLAWKKALIDKKFRIRGQVQVKDSTGETVTKVVGQRIYLPNIVFKMVPNHTAFIRPRGRKSAPIAMEAYNPYMATFRVPKALTKQDIASYLKAVYNLDTTFVRTDVYNSPRVRARSGRWLSGTSKKSYKRAVVGLTKPFHYPNDPDNLTPEAKVDWDRDLNERFFKNLVDMHQERFRLRQMLNKHWQGGKPKHVGKLLGRIAERRRERDQALRQEVMRARNEEFKELQAQA